MVSPDAAVRGDPFERRINRFDTNIDAGETVMLNIGVEDPRSRPPRAPALVPCAALIGVAMLTGCSPDALPPVLSLGPILGAVTDTSVKVWVRADSGGGFRVRYRAMDPVPEGGEQRTSEPAELVAEHDFTGVLTLDALLPGTTYDYEVLMTSKTGEELVHPARFTFRTLPPRGQRISLRFAVGADINRTEIPAFDAISAMDPDFMLLIGDQIYADRVEESADGYRAKYRQIWGGRHFRDFMTHVPVFMMWDDHEIRENYWAGRYTRYEPARQAFDEYQASHNPNPIHEGQAYYSFSAGDVDLFMLETRSNRSSNDDADDVEKSMLGNAQLLALEEWLLTSTATFKILISSVMWSNFGTTQTDSWLGFQSERQRIIDTIYDNGVEGVVIISGDQHWSTIVRNTYRDPPLVIYELEPTPLAFRTGNVSTSSDPSILFRDGDHNAYGVVDIDTTQSPATIKLTVCAVDLPCRPGEEPPPSTPRQAPPDNESIPTTVSLDLTDMGFLAR